MTIVKPVGFSKSQLGGLAVEVETNDKVFLIYGILEGEIGISGFDFRFKADGDVPMKKDWEVRLSDPELHSIVSKEVSAIRREFDLNNMAARIEYLDDLIFTKGISNTLAFCRTRNEEIHFPITDRIEKIKEYFNNHFNLPEEDITFLEGISE